MALLRSRLGSASLSSKEEALTGEPSSLIASRIAQHLSVTLQKETSRAVLRRLQTVGSSVQRSVLNAQALASLADDADDPTG